MQARSKVGDALHGCPRPGGYLDAYEMLVQRHSASPTLHDHIGLQAVAVNVTVDDVLTDAASDLSREPTCQGRCGALAHPRGLAVRAKPLDHRVCHPDEPRPVRHYDHPGQRPIQLSICVERAQPRGEELRIAAPVRMMRPDELPAAPLSIFHV
jgi:hypothetical protein